MIREKMPPMPARYQALQTAYSEMLAAVRFASAHANLTPSTALILAFIGDNSCCAADLRQHGYFLGTNTSHAVKHLTDEGLIETSKGLDRRYRPIKLTPKGRQIAIAIAIRQKLSTRRDTELAAAEAA